MRWMIAAVALAPTPAMAADQFDLICMFGKTEVRYRVDLDRGEACKDGCERVWKIGAVTSGEIRLMDTPLHYPDELPQTITVNRVTGALDHWIGAGAGALNETAACSPAPFTGFPTPKF